MEEIRLLHNVSVKIDRDDDLLPIAIEIDGGSDVAEEWFTEEQIQKLIYILQNAIGEISGREPALSNTEQHND